MPQEQTSLVLAILQRAEELAEAEEDRIRHAFYEDERGALRGITGDESQPKPNVPPTSSTPESGVGTLIDHLDTINTSVSSQITELKMWLQAHPKLQPVLDEAWLEKLKEELDRRERDADRKAIIMNTLFTIFGAIIGLVLPVAVAAIAHLLGR